MRNVMRRFLSFLGLLLCIFSLPVAVPAQSPAPFPDFQAKRLKPPSANVTKRITVQILPEAPEQTAPLLPNDTPQAASETEHDWFWDALSARNAPTGPGRLTDALEILATPAAQEAAALPRLQELQNIAAQYGLDMMLSTVGTEVSPALVLAVAYVESRGQADAQSQAGAQGLMQLMPVTAARFEVADVFDAAQNIKGGVAYLDRLMASFEADPILALAAYNAGETAVRNYNGVPPFSETRAYVPRVLLAFSVAKGLCLTPPLLASDGCVFANLVN